jgi:hypothetical protein
MNWDDPAARLALIEQVGPEAYNEQLRRHLARSVVETVNGYPISPTQTRFGRLFMVGGTRQAYATLGEAQAHAKSLPPMKED